MDSQLASSIDSNLSPVAGTRGTRRGGVARWPGKVAAGQVSSDMVMSIDICATVLQAAGVTPPVPLHGMSLFDPALSQGEWKTGAVA